MMPRFAANGSTRRLEARLGRWGHRSAAGLLAVGLKRTVSRWSVPLRTSPASDLPPLEEAALVAARTRGIFLGRFSGQSLPEEAFATSNGTPFPTRHGECTVPLDR